MMYRNYHKGIRIMRRYLVIKMKVQVKAYCKNKWIAVLSKLLKTTRHIYNDAKEMTTCNGAVLFT